MFAASPPPPRLISNLRRLLNLVFDSPGRASVVAELQIHYRPILELKENEHHFFYGER